MSALAWTQKLELEEDLEAQALELDFCRRSVVHWCNNWVFGYDPRLAAVGKAAKTPFVLWEKQRDFFPWVDGCLADGADGVFEKSRDTGATFLCGIFALHGWLFRPGFVTTFGSRKEDLVDLLGDMKCIFEKIRFILYSLPDWMLPLGYDRKKHDKHLLLLNPHNGNSISGEAGDNMGRGGRSALYVLDEAAFIERADRVDAATAANADCRIFVSSANGTGNVFYRKRHAAGARVFRLHWSDDPRKDEAWAAKKQSELEPVIWASEYDIDYTASLEGICIPAKWVEAAKRLPKLVKLEPHGPVTGGQDVGGGKAKSVFVARQGPIVFPSISWGDPDTTETAHRGLEAAKNAGATLLNFDSVGVGAGVGSTLKNNTVPGLTVQGINTGDTPSNTKWPDGMPAKEKFLNLKAELWWTMRDRAKATYEHVQFLTTGKGKEHPLEDLLALPEDPNLCAELSLPRWFRNEKGKIMIERKDQLAQRGVKSPDFAEALSLTFVPARPRAVIGHLYHAN